MYEFFNKIDKSYVINLKSDLKRKQHVLNQFKKYRITNFEIINAVSYKDDVVKQKFINNDVVAFPPCFRCGLEKCTHENNFITPKQVANFLSMKKIMEIVISKNLNNVLVFEDDFIFKSFVNKSIQHIDKFCNKNNLLDTQNPLLLRMGSHTKVNKKYYLKMLALNKSTFIEGNVENMANPCFLINKLFAKHFLDNFSFISTTSDNFIHRVLCENNLVENYSVYPFPIGQLSYGNKVNKFDSTISENVNSKNNSFEKTQRANSTSDYIKLKNKWIVGT
tara:strand:- start:448 stop:1281 length:834 start_codon:yes stop_codon:yes gene_type:complete